MKVEVNQSQLAHGLSVVNRAVSAKSTLPVLSNILLATDEGRLRLSATNLELGITCWIPANIADEGSITIPSRTLSDLVGTLPNETVKMDLNPRNSTLNIKCGAALVDIKGIDAQEFPPIPTVDMSSSIPLSVIEFKEMIQQVVFATSSDDGRPVLQGVLLTITESTVTMAATDGFRISVRKATLKEPAPSPINAIIPGRALGELARIAVNGDEVIHMVMPSDRGQVIFHLHDAELVSQLIDGNFPDYNAIIPKNFKTHTTTNRENMLKACRQAEVIARDSNNVVRLDITPEGEQTGTIKVSALSEETGSSDITVDATIEGSELAIAFNVRYLREVMEVMGSPNVSLDTNMNNTPALIKPVGNEDFIHVIMPMHIG